MLRKSQAKNLPCTFRFYSCFNWVEKVNSSFFGRLIAIRRKTDMNTEHLKVGDEVVVKRFCYLPRLAKIVSITSEGYIVTDCGKAFNPHGIGVGLYGFNHPYLAEATPDVREEIKRTNLEHKIRTLDFKKLTTSQMEAMVQAATGKH